LILSRLELLNFRNYSKQEIHFAAGRNLIVGRNAQGKSNLLEAAYFLSHLRSSRAPRLRDLVKDGETRSVVRGEVEDDSGRLRISADFGQQGRGVEVNGQRMESTARARGIMKCVLFSPDDLWIVKGDPGRRRELLDETMEELGPVPGSILQKYRHVLRQRNALLRRWEEHGKGAEQAIEPWTEALAQAGAAILVERLSMLEGMKASLNESYRAISGEEKELALLYKGAPVGPEADAREAAEALKQKLAEGRREEIRTRTTAAGPHRDDIEITLGGRGARFAASQGEQRTIAFCLRLAQKEYLNLRTGKMPVLLLDDVLSELDERRRGKVLELVGVESQAIITTTEMAGDEGRTGEKVFRVEDGRVEVV
jgi:DNA replication and repair protein RecF